MTNYLSVLPKVIVCDLDGTLATINGRNPYESEKCESDLPNWPVVECVRAMHIAGIGVIFVSGRKESTRAPSIKWIDTYLYVPGKPTIPYLLHMRPDEDSRSDDVLKVEIYRNHILTQYHVLFVLDDRKKVARALRKELGLTVFAVNAGPKDKTDCTACDGTGVGKPA